MSTPARKAQLINDLREQREALYRTLETLPGEEFGLAQFERDRERASLAEELIRLADAEAAYRGWIEHARLTDGADVRAEPQPVADLEIDDAAAYSAGELVDALAIERRQTLAMVRELEPRDFLRSVHVPAATVTVDDLVAALIRHDRELTNAIARRDGTLLPRFYAHTRRSGLGHA